MEEWKTLNEPFEKYAVSNTGLIKTIKSNKIHSQFERYDGYMQATLHSKGKGKNFKVHRLVAMMFLENENNLPYVNHKDGNKKNNNVDNLEWCTPRQNNLHAVENGLVKSTPIKITDLSNGKEYIFPSIRQGSEFINEDIRLVSRSLKRKNGFLHGYQITKL